MLHAVDESSSSCMHGQCAGPHQHCYYIKHTACDCRKLRQQSMVPVPVQQIQQLKLGAAQFQVNIPRYLMAARPQVSVHQRGVLHVVTQAYLFSEHLICAASAFEFLDCNLFIFFHSDSVYKTL